MKPTSNIIHRQDLLLRPFFILGLMLLLLNDFIWKYEFSNAITGKLSDVAGLFIFPYFISSLRVQYTKQIYCFTILLFVFWKSSISQDMIDWFNSVGIKMYRTIDYSDLLALIIVPFSYLYFNSQKLKVTSRRPVLTAAVSIISVFSFCATTLPHKEIQTKISTNRIFQLNMTKDVFFKSITAAHPYSDSLNKNLKDSLFYLYFNIPELKAQTTALVTIVSPSSEEITIKLDSIISVNIMGNFFSKIKEKDVSEILQITPNNWERYFDENFIKRLQTESSKADLYYDNKELADKYLSQRH